LLNVGHTGQALIDVSVVLAQFNKERFGRIIFVGALFGQI
jgi:hypothetical protein